MVLSYRFKKFRLSSGIYAKRPVVDIVLKNNGKSLEFGAILDSGSDITTVPKAVAEYLEIKAAGEETEMVGYKGSGKVRHGKVVMVFKGKVQRQNEVLNNVPVAIMQ
ncbi:aspartyl protease family protein, partial [Candidatus Woesearchaeota archaeon]|nr:aspartyl protease family protein [Candidatus Woesearchaeota archaeon]